MVPISSFPTRPSFFAHYSFLSHIEMVGEDEIAIHYTFGVVRLIGHHLETIFSLLKQHNLDFARRSGAHNPCRNEIEITQILFADAEATPFKG